MDYVIFNDLSLPFQHQDITANEQAIHDFLKVLAECKQYGIKQIRALQKMGDFMVSDDMALESYVRQMKKGQVNRSLLLSLLTNKSKVLDWCPDGYFPAEQSIKQSQIAKRIYERIDENDDGEPLDENNGLVAAHLLGTLAVGFHSGPPWEQPYIPVRWLDEDGNMQEAKVRHASLPKHMAAHQHWLNQNKKAQESYENKFGNVKLGKVVQSPEQYLPRVQFCDEFGKEFMPELQQPDTQKTILQKLSSLDSGIVKLKDVASSESTSVAKDPKLKKSRTVHFQKLPCYIDWHLRISPKGYRLYCSAYKDSKEFIDYENADEVTFRVGYAGKHLPTKKY